MCNVCDAHAVVEATKVNDILPFTFGERTLLVEAIADDGVEFRPAKFRLRRTRDEEWTPWHDTLDLAGTMGNIGTDVKAKPEGTVRWICHERTEEGDSLFLQSVAVTEELAQRDPSEDLALFRMKADVAKKASIARRNKRNEAIKRMVPRCVEYLGGGWSVRKSGYTYTLKRDGVTVKLVFRFWGSVPRTPARVMGSIKAQGIAVTGDLGSIAWVLARLA